MTKSNIHKNKKEQGHTCCGHCHQEQTKINETNELVKLQQELDEEKNRALRALADYQNLERRMREQIIKSRQDAEAGLIVQILPFLDHLDKAESFIQDTGLRMIKEQFLKTLTEIGLEEIKLLGEIYNPELAEAIEVVEGDDDNKIVEVLEKTYKFRDKVLRIGKVKVSKKAEVKVKSEETQK